MLAFLLAVRVPLKFLSLGETWWFTQKVDHLDKQDKRTFQQQAFYNTNYSKNGKADTLLFYIGGESPLSESRVQTGAIIELAKKTNAVVLGLEHRFFGESVPTDDLSKENLQYLTIEQGLEDLASFITAMKPKYCLKQSECKTVVVGGSYPGSLSAWFRKLHPELADASWSSSAPVLAKADYTEYDEHQAAVIKAYSPKCYDNLTAALKYIEQETTGEDEHQMKMIFQKFGIRPETRFDNSSFLYMIADYLATTIQYKSYFIYLQYMCEELGTAKTDEDKLEVMVQAIGNITDAMGEPFLFGYPMICQQESKDDMFKDMRAWTWMTCNEVGYFQTASGKLRSKKVDLAYWATVCDTLFEHGLPDIDKTNEKYGGLNPQATKTVYINGENDPWSRLGIHNNVTSLDQQAYIVEGGQHCDDLSSPKAGDSESLKWTRSRVIEQIISWISPEPPTPTTSTETSTSTETPTPTTSTETSTSTVPTTSSPSTSTVPTTSSPSTSESSTSPTTSNIPNPTDKQESGVIPMSGKISISVLGVLLFIAIIIIFVLCYKLKNSGIKSQLDSNALISNAI